MIGKLQDLLEAAGRAVHTADLSDTERFPDFAALESWLEDVGTGRAVVHLVNTGRWLQGTRLQSLNLRRDAVAKRLDATLLWWLPPDALERVAKEAPDAWSWRGGVFDFVAEGSHRTEMPPIRPDHATDIGPLTLAQRRRRLAVLHQQLDGNGSADIPDDFRWNLLLEQAELSTSLGQWDFALRTLRQQALPLAERLGDVRERAVTQGKIADILEARGDLDAALRIRLDQELPVFKRLGDVHSQAVTQGKIADILQTRGELDEALRIRTEDELPVFERLGAVHEQAVTRGKIAAILQARGELDSALALYNGTLPIYEELGEMDGIAHVRFATAAIRLLRGDHQNGEIERIHDDLAASFEILRELGRPDAIGAAGELLAEVLAMQSKKTEALDVLGVAENAYEKLGWTKEIKRIRGLRERISNA